MRLSKRGLMSAAALAAICAVAGAAGTHAPVRAAVAQTPPAMSAADLRLTLSRLLTEHVVLTGVALEKQVDGAPDYDAVVTADQQNGQQLGDLIGELYGPEIEGTFLGAWQAHLQGYADYTQGLLDGDAAMQQQGEATLQSYVQTEAGLFASTLGLDEGMLTDDFNTHVEQTLAFVNAYLTHNYATAYTGAGQAIDHMFMVADTLAGAISAQMPQRFPGSADDTAANRRARIDDLLAQHTALAAIAEEKDYDQAPDFPAVADALSMNSQTIAQVIGRAFGDQAAATFLTLWQSHIQDYYDYTAALRDGDPTAADAASAALMTFAQQQAALVVASLPSLDEATVAQMLTDHVQGTQQLIQAYARGDYATTYGIAAAGIDHMFMFGDMLAGALDQVAPTMATP